MKKIYFLLLLWNCKICIAQNYISNGGFENYDSLPTNFGQFAKSKGWSNCQGLGNPDYLHLDGNGGVQLPNSWFAYVNPYKGNAIMGFVIWHGKSNPNYREYLSKTLNTKLSIGTTYRVSFYITNGLPKGHNEANGVDQMSVLFSTTPLKQNLKGVISNVKPQFVNKSILYDTAWQQISFEFKADSTYNFITFGNFVDDSLTQHQLFDSGIFDAAYYFIDEIEVTNLSNGINKKIMNQSLLVYPNPFSNFLNIQFPYNDVMEFILYDNLSRKILQKDFINNLSLNTEQYLNGIYYYEIRSKDGLIRRAKISK